MNARVNKELCTGCGLCTQVCPEVFKMDEDKAIAFVEPIPKDLADKAKEAAEQCPVDAIEVG